MVKVLVIGQGGREHALLWKLAQSSGMGALYAAPGNFGTATIARNIPLAVTDVEGLTEWAASEAIDLTIVGPEAALAAGIVDAFQARNLPIFGPTRAAARIESSKRWAKAFMRRHGIPTADYLEFTSLAEATTHLRGTDTVLYPLVVKADGLMAGKGVTIAADREEALAALQRLEADSSSTSVVIERFLEGFEVSFLAICDGTTARPLACAHDYKRAHDHDQGPMTGGMGAFSPLAIDDRLAETVMRTVILPALHGMAAEGTPFQGVLYAGLILTAEGPMALEFNARFGDPETQVLLPRWNDDLYRTLAMAARGRLAELPPFSWSQEASCGVVVAAAGYPESPRTGDTIGGLDAAATGALVFHCGTRASSVDPSTAVANGGRVLTLVGTGPTVDDARNRAYAATQQISLEGGWYRTDIAMDEVVPLHPGYRGANLEA